MVADIDDVIEYLYHFNETVENCTDEELRRLIDAHKFAIKVLNERISRLKQ